MRHQLFCLFFHGLIATTAGGTGEKDKDFLQGNWQVISVNTGSPDRDKEYLAIIKAIHFDGDTVRMFIKNQVEMMAFKLDSSKNPKWIDIYGTGATPGIPLLGIYALEGNKLRLSWSKIDGKFRPGSFDIQPGRNKTRQISLVLQRLEKK